MNAHHQYDCIVLGAGAAGLMCAITAARRGRSVLVLEKSNKPGKKILMSGGGRCNFTNLHCEPENFLSENPYFCISALSQYTQWDFIQWVESHDIAYHEKKLGQLFCDGSSKDILGGLLNDLAITGTPIHCDEPAQQIDRRPSGGFDVQTSVANYRCESLVVATGGLSIPTLGGSGFGFDLAESLGLPLIPRRAGLVPFVFTDSQRALCQRLAGLSVDVVAQADDGVFAEAMLFTHRGLSGPACCLLYTSPSPRDS